MWKKNDKKDDWKYENEKEIKENIQIKINEEIIKINNYKKKKIKNLPYAIVFSRSFLSFSKDKSIA